MTDWAAWTGIAVAGASGIIAIYTRAEKASLEKDVAVIQARMEALRPDLATEVAVMKSQIVEIQTQTKDNYDYCHTSAHDLRSVAMVVDSRAQNVERELAERVAVLEAGLRGR